MSYGNHIRESRKISGLTQNEVAKNLGVSRATISRWESYENTPSRNHWYNFIDLLRDHRLIDAIKLSRKSRVHGRPFQRGNVNGK